MDNLITTIRRAGDNGSLVVLSLEGNEEVLNKNVSSLDQFVGRCETNFWTCVQAAVILAKLTTCSTVEPQLCSEIQTFFEAANTDHLQLSKRTVRRIGNLLTKKLLSQSSAIRGIPILRTAINRMQNGLKHLTSLHVNICQLAISAKFFSPVIPILNEDILDVDPNKKAYCIQDTLLYFYYGGMVYAAVKMWERSYNFFNLACSLPNLLLSHVAYSAAKKFVLVSLIHKGEFNRTDCKVFSRIKEHLEPYRRLEIAFASQNTSSLQSVIAENRAAFEQDKNLGLVKQLVDCHIKCRIQSLTETYFSLTINDFVTLAGFDSPIAAEQKLIELVDFKCAFLYIYILTIVVFFIFLGCFGINIR
ncbi:unnamed protein product [Hymenolepis diminuta]|uniref:COP9 signalosome complex subunit 3 N-terminal helical repeats domain-containing protein n=1 Tax=Hymenolepis diminuta TaxID=6216 RepID=A0A564Y969_HYMDI|nr:unnamed protein product [Hymenolepis diminuta]